MEPQKSFESLPLGSNRAIFIATILFILFIIKVCLSYLLQRRNDRVPPSIPRVPGLALIAAIFTYFRKRQGILQILETLMQKYGRTFCVKFRGTNVVFTSDAEIAKKLVNSSQPGHMEKPGLSFSKFLPGSLLNEGLIISKFETWQPRRQLFSKAYTHHHLKLYAPIISDYAEKAISDLKLGKTIPHVIHKGTLQVIAHLTSGMDLMNNLQANDFLNNIERSKELVKVRSNPFLAIDLIWNFHPNSKELIKLTENMENWLISDCIRVVKQSPKEAQNDFVSPLKMMIDAGFDERSILSELITLIFAGHETTSMSIILLMMQLALNEEHQKECRKEVDDLFMRMKEEGRTQISLQDCSDLKYLERCIKESLRINPTIPILGRELHSPFIIGDNAEIGTGCRLIVATWVIHRNPEYFPNPEKFNPDRFLPEECKSRHSHAYMPFSTGQRNCIGWRLALLEITIFSAWILRHFEVFTKDTFNDIKLDFMISLGPEREPNFELIKRVE